MYLSSPPRTPGGGNLFCHRHVDASRSGHITNSNPADATALEYNTPSVLIGENVWRVN